MGELEKPTDPFEVSITPAELHADAGAFRHGELEVMNRRFVFEANRLEPDPEKSPVR